MSLLDDVDKLHTEVDRLSATIDVNRDIIGRHEEQISGPRGLQASIEDLSKEIQSLRKAAYTVGGLIVAGAISFAFSVLALVGGG